MTDLERWIERVNALNIETGLAPDVADQYGELFRPWSELGTLDELADEVRSIAATAARKASRFAGLAGAIRRAANAEKAK